MAMTIKQAILATARGEHAEKVPYVPRIDVWYNYNVANDKFPEKYKGWRQTDILRDQGVGSGQYRFFTVVKEEYRDMEVIVTHDEPYIMTEYRTPLGTLSKKDVFSRYEGAWIVYEMEKLFKTEKDYPIIKYILEHTDIVDNFEPFQKVRDEVGEDGMVMSGLGLWSAPQRVMREIMGYEQFFYELADRPAQVEELLEVMKDLERRKYKVAIGCDLEIFNLCANWSDDIHTPVFRKYFTPWFKEVTDFLHAHGRLAMVHVDGEMRRLNPLLRETDIDIAEAVTPAPQSLVPIKEFRRELGDKITIWGGIPSILFEPIYSDEDFDNYVKNLLKDIAPGYRFIVGMGDNLPFDGSIDRVGRVAELIDRYGKLPIQI